MTAKLLHDASDDSQSETWDIIRQMSVEETKRPRTKPGGVRAWCSLHLLELPEDALQFIVGDTATRVRYYDLHCEIAGIPQACRLLERFASHGNRPLGRVFH